MPGGALVDAARSHRLLAALAIAAIGCSAVALAVWPIFAIVLASRVLHAGASCVLGPTLAVLSLRVAGYAGMGERLGRNARFASIGNGLAAAAMGACGLIFSNQAVFFFTAALTLPALLALAQIRTREAHSLAIANRSRENAYETPASLRTLATNRSLLIFAGCIALFQLANAAMLPLMGGILTTRAGEWASMLIGAC